MLISGATNATLSLSNVDIPASGDYSVVVVNAAGSDTSTSADLSVTAKLREAWQAVSSATPGRPSFGTVVKADPEGNTYVTGYVEMAGRGNDFVTIKYSPAGTPLWTVTYDGPASADDFPVALAVDSTGNVIVTGSSKGSGTGLDFATIKYDPNGNVLWTARYNGPGINKDDVPAALSVDLLGNVYVTGSAKVGDKWGFATVQYDPDGNQLWAVRYTGGNLSDDEAVALTVDAGGSVYVAGKSKGPGSDFDYATVKYDALGNLIWAARYIGPGNSPDVPAQVAVDADGNVHVTGTSKGNNSDFDYATVKYDAHGRQLWLVRYNGLKNKADRATSLALDPSGNVIVTGTSTGIEGDLDYLTIEYSPEGIKLWEARYNGPADGDDLPQALAADNAGNVYVTGGSPGLGTKSDYATVKYSADGQKLWEARYDGPDNAEDVARALVLDGDNNVVVTGESKGTDGQYDCTTIKYLQPRPPVITEQPLSQAIDLGGTVLFSAAAEGTPPLHWQWRLNGQDIPGATNAALLLSDVQPEDGGNYQVVVANAAAAVESDKAFLTINLLDLTMADNFADRAVNAALFSSGRASNVGATRENGEPRHDGKTPTHSVWMSWRAPASGIVTFTTAGSDFDTVLAVYTGTELLQLTPVAGDDDSGNFFTSRVLFNAQVGQEYQIAIDGVNGAAGQLMLSWQMEITTDRLPVITSMPDGHTVGLGEDATFTVDIDQPNATFQWFQDGLPLPNATDATQVVPSVQPDSVGLYTSRRQDFGFA